MSDNPTQENKSPSPGVTTSQSQKIRLKVLDQDSSVTNYGLKVSNPLGRLMNNYCERTGEPRSFLRFLYDGKRIQDENTPEELGMQDQDIIEVYREQTGGV